MLQIQARMSRRKASEREIQTLLERLLVEVVAENYRYFVHEHLSWDQAGAEHWCSPPLLGRERQMSGLFANALSRVCPVLMPEHAIIRRQAVGGPTAVREHVDYLAAHGDRSIALELKGARISTTENTEWQRARGKWDEVVQQAREARDCFAGRPDKYQDPVGIGLLVLRVGRTVGHRPPHEVLDQQRDLFRAMLGDLKSNLQPDFMASYEPPREMQYSKWDEDTAAGVFPGMVFAARVHMPEMD